MAERCPRCHRAHTGVCGIPPGVTLGFGARRIDRGLGQPTQGKPQHRPLGTAVLEGMLAQARMHLSRVFDTLRVTPSELPEYGELLDRESKLHQVIKQLIGQIAERRR